MRRRLYVRIKEIALSLQCDATLRKGRIKTNANPPLVSTNYDPLPNIAEEHVELELGRELRYVDAEHSAQLTECAAEGPTLIAAAGHIPFNAAKI